MVFALVVPLRRLVVLVVLHGLHLLLGLWLLRVVFFVLLFGGFR
jgi:hypothetical protein